VADLQIYIAESESIATDLAASKLSATGDMILSLVSAGLLQVCVDCTSPACPHCLHTPRQVAQQVNSAGPKSVVDNYNGYSPSEKVVVMCMIVQDVQLAV